MKLRAALLVGAILAMGLLALAGCEGQPQPTPAPTPRVVEIAQATAPAMLAPTAANLPPSPTATITPSPTATATARPPATATATPNGYNYPDANPDAAGAAVGRIHAHAILSRQRDRHRAETATGRQLSALHN